MDIVDAEYNAGCEEKEAESTTTSSTQAILGSSPLPSGRQAEKQKFV